MTTFNVSEIAAAIDAADRVEGGRQLKNLPLAQLDREAFRTLKNAALDAADTPAEAAVIAKRFDGAREKSRGIKQVLDDGIPGNNRSVAPAAQVAVARMISGLRIAAQGTSAADQNVLQLLNALEAKFGLELTQPTAVVASPPPPPPSDDETDMSSGGGVIPIPEPLPEPFEPPIDVFPGVVTNDAYPGVAFDGATGFPIIDVLDGPDFARTEFFNTFGLAPYNNVENDDFRNLGMSSLVETSYVEQALSMIAKFEEASTGDTGPSAGSIPDPTYMDPIMPDVVGSGVIGLDGYPNVLFYEGTNIPAVTATFPNSDTPFQDFMDDFGLEPFQEITDQDTYLGAIDIFLRLVALEESLSKPNADVMPPMNPDLDIPTAGPGTGPDIDVAPPSPDGLRFAVNENYPGVIFDSTSGAPAIGAMYPNAEFPNLEFFEAFGLEPFDNIPDFAQRSEELTRFLSNVQVERALSDLS